MKLFSTNARRLAASFFLIAAAGVFLCLSRPACADSLRGGVQIQDYLHTTPGPSLNRGDIGGDPFASGEASPNLSPIQQRLEPPQGAFPVQSPRPPAPPPDFNLHAEDAAPAPDFEGKPGQGTEAPSTAMVPTAGPLNPNEQSGRADNDPDKSPEMQLAWDAWHRRVAEAVYRSFVSMSHTAFKYSHPLAAYVSYTVTRDGRILNTQLQQKSSNVAFNAMVLLVVNSISGQRDLLEFPPGSRRMSVEKGGMFTENYGPQQGFKFTTGDRETIHTN